MIYHKYIINFIDLFVFSTWCVGSTMSIYLLICICFLVLFRFLVFFSSHIIESDVRTGSNDKMDNGYMGGLKLESLYE